MKLCMQSTACCPVQHLSTKLAEEVRICCWHAGRRPAANPAHGSAPGFQRSFLFTNLRCIKYDQVWFTIPSCQMLPGAARWCKVLPGVFSMHTRILTYFLFVFTYFVCCFDFSQLRLCTKVEMFGASKGTCQRDESKMEKKKKLEIAKLCACV